VATPLSGALAALVGRSLEELSGSDAARTALAAAPAEVAGSVRAAFAGSDFLAHACARDPQLLVGLLASGDLQRTLTAGDFAERAPALPDTLPESQALDRLRSWRRRELARIAWRDLAGWAELR
jgi:glutamate-ammonia-ligase adenylyltransferase